MKELIFDTEGKIVEVEDGPGTEIALAAGRTGILSGFAKTQVMGIPIGAAGVGLLTVSVWDAIRGLVGGMLPAAIPAWLVPAIGAMAVQSKMIKGFMGADASNAAGLILTADAIQSLFNVKGLVSGLVSGSGIKLGQTMRGNTVLSGTGEITSIEQYNLVHGLS